MSKQVNSKRVYEYEHARAIVLPSRVTSCEVCWYTLDVKYFGRP